MLRTAAVSVMLVAATAHAARLPELLAAGTKTRVRGSTRISLCILRLEVKQAPRTHRGNALGYDGTAVVLPDDLNGNTVSETTTPSGQPAQVTTNGWDRDNRLRSVTPPSGAATTYGYDAKGLRTQRVDATGTTRYLLDGASVLEELDGGNAATTHFMSSPAQIDDVFAYQRTGAMEYPLTDALGSVYAATDSTGAVVHRYDLDVYGNRTDVGGSGVAIDVGFGGRWHDANGLVEHRDRLRNPRLGGWLQADRAGMINGANLYLGFKVHPTMQRDPRGMYTEVIMHAPEGWLSSSLGHIAVRVNDTAYSFAVDPEGHNDMEISRFDFYMAGMDDRDAIGIQIDLSQGEERQLVVDMISYGNMYKWEAIGPNCTVPIQEALYDLGLGVSFVNSAHLLQAELASHSRAVGQTYYPATARSGHSSGRDSGNALWGNRIWQWLLNRPDL